MAGPPGHKSPPSVLDGASHSLVAPGGLPDLDAIIRARSSRTVQVTPSNSKLRFCTGVGSVSIVKVASPSATCMVLPVRGTEVGEQGSEAVHGEVVVGAFAGGLGACGGRALGLLYHRGALSFGSGRVVVVEQQWLEGLV